MSQAGIINTSSGPVPPTVPTSFVTDSGTVIASGSVVTINGGSTTANNSNGITVIANPNGSMFEVVELTNRATGAVTTTGATSANVITFALGATPGVYTFDITVAGFAKTGVSAPLGCGYTIVGSVRTTGAAATLIPTQVVDHFEEGALGVPPQATAILAVSGNSAVVTVTGVSDGAAGYVIDWVATLNYTFAS
jgi:hypothetical protein